MGKLRDELREPWGPILAGTLGGLAWAVGAPVVAAVAVGAAVYGVKAALGVAMNGTDSRRTPAPPRPLPGTPGAIWLGRAEHAVKALHDMARGQAADPSPTELATARAASEADEVLEAMEKLGGHVVAVGQALARSDAPGLDQEAAQLGAAAKHDPDDQSAAASARAVADRVQVRNRLREALADLEGRMQSSALGLEGLVARVAEIRATSASVGEVDTASSSLAALTTELDGLRVGLADVEQIASRALGQSG